MPIGTFVNVFTVLLGSTLGRVLRNRFPEKIKKITFQGLGLISIVLGIQMALKVENWLVVIFSLLLGGILGEAISLEKRLEQSADFLKKKIGSKEERFVEGLITSFILFCVGSVTIVGAIQEGLTGDRTLILTKAVLDGFSSIALASVYGAGVTFSVIPLLIFQGGLTLLAFQLQGFLSERMVNEISAVGGILIVGLGINLLEIRQIAVNNMLPALIFVLILKWLEISFF